MDAAVSRAHTFPSIRSWLKAEAEPLVIAGPCGAESFDQLHRTAGELKALHRISLLRCGVWKPRTRPNDFEGKGEDALKWLRDIRAEFGLPFAVEIATAGHAELALKYGVDVVWLGARTMANPFSVQEVADSLRGTDIPVLVKNPIHDDLNLWIGGIERVCNAGITKIAAVHRGFHFYGRTKYRNRPLWQIPIELRTIFPDLPILCDPSHISGNRDLIPQVSQKALDIGMDGLMIESHYDPAVALSDARQQLTPSDLGDLLAKLVVRRPRSADPEFTDRLHELRKVIDEIDDELLNLLKKRLQIVERIGEFKKAHNITIFQLERWQEILRTRGQWADKLGIQRQHVEKICQLLHEESIRVQNAVMNPKDR
jgi:chorismate mutase